MYLLYNQPLLFCMLSQTAQLASAARPWHDYRPALITGLHFPPIASVLALQHITKQNRSLRTPGQQKPHLSNWGGQGSILTEHSSACQPFRLVPHKKNGEKHFILCDSLVDVSTKEEPRKVAASITRAEHFLLFLRSCCQLIFQN